MGYFECEGNVYFVDDDGSAHSVSVTAKDKVVEVRELESVTAKVDTDKVELPAGAMPVTIDELVAKFNISEKNPVKFDSTVHAKLTGKAAKKTSTANKSAE